MIVSVEGCIGTGKSTFIELIKQQYKDKPIIFLQEPLDKWLQLKDSDNENILEKFYKDQKRWSYSFQMNAFITRSKQILENNPKDSIIVIERSVITDRRVFAELLKESGKISDMEWELYNQWYYWLTENFNVIPDMYVYLRANSDVSFERMKKRARKEEDIIPKEYIEAVSKKHDDWLFNEHKSLVITIDVNNDFEKDIEFRQNILKIFSDILDQRLNK